jgi:hypothetical protein
MELYEAKDLPSADLSNQHVDDDSNREVKRLGVPKVNGFFFMAIQIQFLFFYKDILKMFFQILCFDVIYGRFLCCFFCKH